MRSTIFPTNDGESICTSKLYPCAVFPWTRNWLKAVVHTHTGFIRLNPTQIMLCASSLNHDVTEKRACRGRAFAIANQTVPTLDAKGVASVCVRPRPAVAWILSGLWMLWPTCGCVRASAPARITDEGTWCRRLFIPPERLTLERTLCERYSRRNATT